jgi:hypothetical protein
MAPKGRFWLQGTKLLAVLAATGTAYAHHGVSAPGCEINLHNNGNGIDTHVYLHGEKSQNEPGSGFPDKLAFKTQISFPASITSTGSTISITSYMRERGIFKIFRSTNTDFEGLERRNSTFYATPPCNSLGTDDETPNPTHSARNEPKKRQNQEMIITEEIDGGLTTSPELYEGGTTVLETIGHQFGPQQTDISSNLHHYSTELFTSLAPYMTECPQLLDSSCSIQEDMGRLYLWGEAFGDGQLDIILQASEELRTTILELNATISNILIHGRWKGNAHV